MVLGGDQVAQTENKPDLESSHGPWPRRTGGGPLRPRSAESESVEAAQRSRERSEARGHQPSASSQPAEAETSVGRSHLLTPVLPGPGVQLCTHTHFKTTFTVSVINRNVSAFMKYRVFWTPIGFSHLFYVKMLKKTYVAKWVIEFPLTNKLKAAFPFSF